MIDSPIVQRAIAERRPLLIVAHPGMGPSMLARAFHAKVAPGAPFRAPHHTVTWGGMFGSATSPRPSARIGEVALARGGVLYLDELAEYRREVLDSLAQLAESGDPDAPIMVASSFPCPCGYRGHPRVTCTCKAETVARYWGRIVPFLRRAGFLRVDLPSAPLASPAPPN